MRKRKTKNIYIYIYKYKMKENEKHKLKENETETGNEIEKEKLKELTSFEKTEKKKGEDLNQKYVGIFSRTSCKCHSSLSLLNGQVVQVDGKKIVNSIFLFFIVVIMKKNRIFE